RAAHRRHAVGGEPRTADGGASRQGARVAATDGRAVTAGGTRRDQSASPCQLPSGASCGRPPPTQLPSGASCRRPPTQAPLGASWGRPPTHVPLGATCGVPPTQEPFGARRVWAPTRDAVESTRAATSVRRDDTARRRGSTNTPALAGDTCGDT